MITIIAKFDVKPDKVDEFIKSSLEVARQSKKERGNHEELLLELVKCDAPSSVDYPNGTLNTFCHINNDLMLIPEYFIVDRYWGVRYPEEFNKYWKKAQKNVRNSEIIKWLKSDEITNEEFSQ